MYASRINGAAMSKRRRVLPLVKIIMRTMIKERRIAAN